MGRQKRSERSELDVFAAMPTMKKLEKEEKRTGSMCGEEREEARARVGFVITIDSSRSGL